MNSYPFVQRAIKHMVKSSCRVLFQGLEWLKFRKGESSLLV